MHVVPVGDHPGVGFRSGEAARLMLDHRDTPWATFAVDLSDDSLDLHSPHPGPIAGALLIVHVDGVPVGTVWLHCEHDTELVPGDVVRAVVTRELGAAAHRPEAGSPETSGASGSQEPGPSAAQALTVVVCTRGRPEGLARTLHSLGLQTGQRVDVVVVDNTPDLDGTGPEHTEVSQVVDEVVAADPTLPAVRLVREPVPGLSRARNAGLAASTTELTAFLDDDEIAPPHWARAVVANFDLDPQVDCVSGPILPALLDTRARRLFELWGGHDKGVAFARHRFDGRELGRSRSLLPVPAFGAGGNMAFRTAALRSLHGFDIDLGAGTPVPGAEDTDVFSRLLHAGGRIVKDSGAYVLHSHRETMDDLHRQIHGYGAGTTAWYSSLMLGRSGYAMDLLRLAPRVLSRYGRSSGSWEDEHSRGVAACAEPSTGHGADPEDSARAALAELLPSYRRGLARGPVLYARSRLRNRRLDRAANA